VRQNLRAGAQGVRVFTRRVYGQCDLTFRGGADCGDIEVFLKG
jgi:hypothetical protein